MIISAVGNEFPTADIIYLQFFTFFVFSNDNMLQIAEYEYCVGATLLDCNALHWRRQWGGTAELSNKVSKTGDTMVGDLAISNGHGRFIGGIYNGYGFLKLIAVNGSESTLIQLETGASKVPFVEKSVNGINVSTIPIALAEPPQEYSLPLASGWSGSATYFKAQDCVCTLNVTLKKGEAIGSGTFIVATIPVSFRPAIAASCCAINEKGGYITTTASHFAVHKTGEVAIQMNDPMAVGFRASLTYKATN